MAHGVDTPVQPVQPACVHPEPHRVCVETGFAQLPHRDHPVLPRCRLGYSKVGWGAKVGHTPTKAPHPVFSPLAGMPVAGI